MEARLFPPRIPHGSVGRLPPRIDAGVRPRLAPTLAALLALLALVASGCRPACELPEGQVLTRRPARQAAQPGLDATLRKCVHERGIRPDGASDAASAWSRFLRGDGSALPNDAKIGALLFFRRHECRGCSGPRIAARVSDALSGDASSASLETRYLSVFRDALGVEAQAPSRPMTRPDRAWRAEGPIQMRTEPSARSR